MKGGATAAECVVREGDEFSTLVRLGAGRDPEGIRLKIHRSARLLRTARRQHLLQRLLPRRPRPHAEVRARARENHLRRSLRRNSRSRSARPDLTAISISTHEDVYSLPGADRIDYARRAEKAALDFDPRIKNSEGGSFDAATGHKVLANSHGFVGEYSRSYCSVAAVPIAQTEDGAMQRDYWYSVARTLNKLDSPEKVGKIAAERTLRRLGARKAKTAKVPVVLRSHGRRPRSSSTFSKASTETPSIAAHHFSPASWARRSPATTSPSSTMARSPADSAPARSTAKASPRAAPS